MSSPVEYVAGFVLCIIVALVYSMARKDEPAEVIREALLVLGWILGAIAVIVLAVFVATMFV